MSLRVQREFQVPPNTPDITVSAVEADVSLSSCQAAAPSGFLKVATNMARKAI